MPLLLAAWRAVMQVKECFLFFSLSFFFPFRVLIMSFPQRRKKVVCKAKIPKHFSSLHGRIKCDLWTCHFELSGAKSEQIARQLTFCSQLLKNRRLHFLLLCWKHLLCKAKKWMSSIAKILLLLQCQIELEIVTDPHLGHHFSYIFDKLMSLNYI